MPLMHPWPIPPLDKMPKSWARKSHITMAVVGSMLKIWADHCNTFNVYNRQTLLDAVDKRPTNQPLITVSNHTSCMDDPLIWASLHYRHLTRENDRLRWGLGGHNVMFKTPLLNKFCSWGRGVPVVRGEGVYQQAMDFSLELLQRGQWVHVFPEGKINMTKDTLRLKWGVGRLIAESPTVPTVIPMWHFGMDDVLPNKRPYIPQVGKKITLFVGEPMDFTSTVQELEERKATPKEKRKVITDEVQVVLAGLKEKTRDIHFSDTTPATYDQHTNAYQKVDNTLEKQAFENMNNVSENQDNVFEKDNVFDKDNVLERRDRAFEKRENAFENRDNDCMEKQGEDTTKKKMHVMT